MADDAGGVASKDLSSEAGLQWRHFAVWREKIIAGYLAITAAIATAFVNVQESDRIFLLLAAIVVCVVFWLFDFRNRLCMGVCQSAAASIELAIRPSQTQGQYGGYTALTALRFAHLKPVKAQKQINMLTHGLAVDLLVAGIIAACSCRITAHLLCMSSLTLVFLIVGAIISALLVWAAHKLGKAEREWETALTNNIHTSTPTKASHP
jgi:hypothetical protein